MFENIPKGSSPQYKDAVLSVGDLPQLNNSIDDIRYVVAQNSFYHWNGASWAQVGGGSGTGDVVGPASAVNNNLAAFDGNSGKSIKDSGI